MTIEMAKQLIQQARKWAYEDGNIDRVLLRALRELPKPAVDGRERTHFADCWRYKSHHPCCVAKVEKLERELADCCETLSLSRQARQELERDRVEQAEAVAECREKTLAVALSVRDAALEQARANGAELAYNIIKGLEHTSSHMNICDATRQEMEELLEQARVSTLNKVAAVIGGHTDPPSSGKIGRAWAMVLQTWDDDVEQVREQWEQEKRDITSWRIYQASSERDPNKLDWVIELKALDGSVQNRIVFGDGAGMEMLADAMLTGLGQDRDVALEQHGLAILQAVAKYVEGVDTWKDFTDAIGVEDQAMLELTADIDAALEAAVEERGVGVLVAVHRWLCGKEQNIYIPGPDSEAQERWVDKVREAHQAALEQVRAEERERIVVYIEKTAEKYNDERHRLYNRGRYQYAARAGEVADRMKVLANDARNQEDDNDT